MSKLFEVYTDILAMVFREVRRENNVDYVLTPTADKKIAYHMVAGKKMVLPTRDTLRHYRANEMCVFHPFKENIDHKPSNATLTVMSSMQQLLSLYSNRIAAALAMTVMDSDYHATFTPEQGALLRAVPEVDEKTLEIIRKSSAAMNTITIALPRNRRINNTQYLRSGVVTLASLEKYADLESNYGGSKVRSNQLLNIYRFIFDEAKVASGKVDTSAYTRGSNDVLAPSFTAFLKTVEVIAQRLNYLIALYPRMMESCDIRPLSINWVGKVGDTVESFRGEITSIPHLNEVVADDEPAAAKSKAEKPKEATPPWVETKTPVATAVAAVKTTPTPPPATPATSQGAPMLSAQEVAARMHQLSTGGRMGHAAGTMGGANPYGQQFHNPHLRANMTHQERYEADVRWRREQEDQKLRENTVIINNEPHVNTDRGFMPLATVLKQNQQEQLRIPDGAIKGEDGKYYIKTPNGYIECKPETVRGGANGLPVVTSNTPRTYVDGRECYEINGQFIPVDDYERRYREQQNGYGNGGAYGNNPQGNYPPRVLPMTPELRRRYNNTIMRLNAQGRPCYYRDLGNNKLMEV